MRYYLILQAQCILSLIHCVPVIHNKKLFPNKIKFSTTLLLLLLLFRLQFHNNGLLMVQAIDHLADENQKG